MPPELFTIRRDGPGRLSTMARPHGGDRLPDELSGLVSAGVDVLVSLLSDPEVAGLQLEQEGPLATRLGMEFHRLATPDLQVPARLATLELVAVLRERLAGGAGIAVHCHAGIGRSSTLAAAVLVLDGDAPADAWARISAARGLPVPETDGQREFVATLEALRPRSR